MIIKTINFWNIITEMFKLIAEDLHFSEGPRWHDNKLWFSDFYQHAVFNVDERRMIYYEKGSSKSTQPDVARFIEQSKG